MKFASQLNCYIIIIIIIIIIIKRGRHCKAGRECATPYQSKDPRPTIPWIPDRKKSKRKVVEVKLERGYITLGYHNYDKYLYVIFFGVDIYTYKYDYRSKNCRYYELRVLIFENLYLTLPDINRN